VIDDGISVNTIEKNFFMKTYFFLLFMNFRFKTGF